MGEQIQEQNRIVNFPRSVEEAPADENVAQIIDLLQEHLRDRGAKSRAEACRELVWALVSSAEFRFNH